MKNILVCNSKTSGSWELKFGHKQVSMHIFQISKRHLSIPISFYAMMEYVPDFGARQSSTPVYAAAYAAAVVYSIPKMILDHQQGMIELYCS